MIVVSDTSPIVLLAKLDLLDLLVQLFGTVLVPEAVVREVGERAADLARVRACGGIVVRTITNVSAAQAFYAFLGPGESETIVLAQETGASLVLTDDMRARRVAESFGIKVAGTLAVVIMACERQLIEDGPAVVRRLREEGLWLSDSLYREAIQRVSRSSSAHTVEDEC